MVRKNHSVQSLDTDTSATYKETSYQQDTLEKYLVGYAADGIRFSAGTLVLFFLNVFFLIPIFSVPFQLLYASILLPILAIMNVWAIALIIAPRRLQLNYVLFRGVFGVVSSLGFIIMIQKFAYGMLGLTTPWYAISSFTLYGLALFQYSKFHVRKLQQSLHGKKSGEGTPIPITTLPLLTGVGYILANISLAFVTQHMVVVVLICVYSMLAFVVFHFIMDLHRYYWILNHRLK